MCQIWTTFLFTCSCTKTCASHREKTLIDWSSITHSMTQIAICRLSNRVNLVRIWMSIQDNGNFENFIIYKILILTYVSNAKTLKWTCADYAIMILSTELYPRWGFSSEVFKLRRYNVLSCSASHICASKQTPSTRAVHAF